MNPNLIPLTLVALGLCAILTAVGALWGIWATLALAGALLAAVGALMLVVPE